MSSNNIYNILGKLKGISDTAAQTPTAETLYESVEPRGSITEAVKSLESKYQTFKESTKPDFLDVDKDGNKKEPFKKAVKDKKAVTEVFSDEEAKAQRDATKDRAWKAKGEANTKKYEKNKKAAEKRAQERAAKKNVAEDGVSRKSADFTTWVLQQGDKFKDFTKNPDTYAAAQKAYKAANKKVAEAAYDEPAAPDAEAIAKRKRLQAIKDRQEEQGNDYSNSNTPIRKVAGKAYGGAAQKDAPEADLDEETSATGGEITKKGNVTTHKAKKYGGEEEHTNNIGNSKDIMDRKSHKRVVDVGDPEDYDLDEVAPPGAKAERMVKHIKKGYAGDGKLTKKEKGIAYATAWKAHNKGQVEEGVEFKDAGKIKNSAPNMKKAKLAKVTESRVMEETDYFYEKVGKALAEKNPNLDTAAGEFVDAMRKEMVAQGIPPNRARNIIMMDDDFISDVATSYGHYCKEMQAEGVLQNAPLDNSVRELDEIAALAGIAAPTHEQSAGLEHSVDVMDETAEEDDEERRLEHYHELISAGMDPDDAEVIAFNDEELEEADMSEGNEFSGALAAAKASGAKEFEVDGKRYTVKEDINVNITASGEEDALNLFRKLAGMSEVEAQPALRNVNPVIDAESAIAQGIIEPVEVDEERDIEYTNTPNEKIGPLAAAIPSGTDLNRSKEQDPRTANRAANPLAVKEDTLWNKYAGMLKSLIK